MYLPESHISHEQHAQRRSFPRYQVQCRARIRIGNRQYAGYIHNISRGGAKLRTITTIRKVGSVILRLPDLPPLRCQLRWTDSYNAGVSFELVLPSNELRRWAAERRSFPGREPFEVVAELEELGSEDQFRAAANAGESKDLLKGGSPSRTQGQGGPPADHCETPERRHRSKPSGCTESHGIEGSRKDEGAGH